MAGVVDIDITLSSPHSGQKEVLRSKARFKVLMCGRRWGKSAVSMLVSILFGIKKQSIAYVTPTYELSKIFFDDILATIPPEVVKSRNRSDLRIIFVTGGSISFMTGEKLNKFRGRKFYKVIIDEAAYIPDLENAWLNSIRPTLTDYEGEALFISTPRGKGSYFYTLYLKGLDPNEIEWESFHYETATNPFIKASEIESARLSLPKAVFEQEYRAIPNANAKAVLDADDVEANTIKTLSTKPTVVFGIDVSGGSLDSTAVIGLDEDGVMTYQDVFKLSHEQVFKRLLLLPNGIPKYIDSTGIGSVQYDRLINSGAQNWIPYQFNTASKPPLIQNMLIDIEQGKLKFTNEVALEFSTFEYKYSIRSNQILYSAISGMHDDLICALGLANHGLQFTKVSQNIMKSFGF